MEDRNDSIQDRALQKQHHTNKLAQFHRETILKQTTGALELVDDIIKGNWDNLKVDAENNNDIKLLAIRKSTALKIIDKAVPTEQNINVTGRTLNVNLDLTSSELDTLLIETLERIPVDVTPDEPGEV